MSKLKNPIPYTGVHHADHLPKLRGPALELPGAGHVQAEQQQAGEHHGHPHGVIITMITVNCVTTVTVTRVTVTH